MTLPLLALLPFAGWLVLAATPNAWRRAAAWCAAVPTVVGLGVVLLLAPRVMAGEVLRWSVDWVPALGLTLGFRMDGLAWLFALLIFGIGALVVLYAAYYLDKSDPAARFFQFLLLFMGAMVGVVLADNLLLLVMFWEATSLSSFLLIGYWNERKEAREGARMALAITGAGGLALLGGVLLIGHIVGSLQLDAVLAAGDRIRAHPLYVPALVLVLLGAFTKSAQFPFHFWLPQAMAAPTPVSAYLHSATMVKAGVFLLARLYPALGGSDAWFWIVAPVGLATLLIGAYVAIFQHDLKGLLAYSTISHLGLITLLFGLDSPLAVVAGVFHILNHATFKASLFMAAGIIDHETGSRDMRQLNGLWKYMPWTALLAMVASASMAGVPLLNGFLSKEMFFAETLATDGHTLMQWLLPIGATIAGMLSVAYSARFIHDVFFNGEPVGLAKTPHEPPLFMRVPVDVLVLICLAVGIAPAAVIAPVLAVGARAALGTALPEYSLAIWHGFNLPLAMSAIALAGGITLYFGLQRFINLHRVLPRASAGRAAFVFALRSVIRAAGDLTRGLQNGSLQRYLLLLIVVAVAAGALPFLAGSSSGLRSPALTVPSLAFAVLWAIGMIAALATAVDFRRRLLALIILGAVGLVVALVFVYLSAPDLALTQLLVEVATVILMMLALQWLPEESPPERSRGMRWFHLGVACAAGIGVAALLWYALGLPVQSISPYFLETTVAQGGGANAVNVIIVDYRGFDTLGEITVLGVAALIIAALLRGRHFESAATARLAAATERSAHPLMLQIVARLLLPLAVLATIHLFLRGHNLPGGGFIAGLVLAIALLLLGIAHGAEWLEARGFGDFRPWVAAGLLVAALTGAASWLLDHPFLTSTYDYPVLPLLGPVPLASASLFDLGVFLTVVGGTVMMLAAIARLRKGGA
jgi:multicomponent K+:H+ antiporter subunit A